jgi:hypothetical protein
MSIVHMHDPDRCNQPNRWFGGDTCECTCGCAFFAVGHPTEPLCPSCTKLEKGTPEKPTYKCNVPGHDHSHCHGRQVYEEARDAYQAVIRNKNEEIARLQAKLIALNSADFSTLQDPSPNLCPTCGGPAATTGEMCPCGCSAYYWRTTVK